MTRNPKKGCTRRLLMLAQQVTVVPLVYFEGD